MTLGTYTDCRRRRHFLPCFVDGGELAQKMKFRRNQTFLEKPSRYQVGTKVCNDWA